MPSGMSQRLLAAQAGMKPDALSRALNGQRGFSSAELARIAEELDANLYWLATGNENPHRVQIAARHSWDANRRVSTNPGRSRDDEILAQVVDVYNEAFPDGPPPSVSLTDRVAHIREMLGEDFVRTFGAVVENRLGVDVVRLPGLTTDYSLTIGSRAVVLLATTPSWFRSNWSLAHELAHLALGHHNATAEPTEKDEAPANRFAAELLLPKDAVERERWECMDERGLVARVRCSSNAQDSSRAVRSCRRLSAVGLSHTVIEVAIQSPSARETPLRDALIGRVGAVDVSEFSGAFERRLQHVHLAHDLREGSARHLRGRIPYVP